MSVSPEWNLAHAPEAAQARIVIGEGCEQWASGML
jgi:hypothetical protein